MNYFVGIGGVALFQAVFSYAIILAGTGNGSFVGLGAMLFAVVGIPITAIMNFVFIRTSLKNPEKKYLVRLFLFALILPLAQITLLVLVSVFNL